MYVIYVYAAIWLRRRCVEQLNSYTAGWRICVLQLVSVILLYSNGIVFISKYDYDVLGGKIKMTEQVKVKDLYKRSHECIGDCRPFDIKTRTQLQCKWYDPAYSRCTNPKVKK